MVIGIIGAMDPEVETLVSKLSNKKTTTIGSAIFYSGTLCDKNVVISRSGIGKVCAASVTAILISVFNANIIINTGCAGGIGSGLKVGDTLFSTKVAHHDVDLTIFGYKKGQMAAHELYFEADPGLIAKAEIAASNSPKFADSIKKGIVVSGDQFISSKEKKAELVKEFPGAMVAEMEGAAIAQVASDFKVPFLIIRAVSDCAEEGNSMTYDEFMPIAADKSATLVCALLPLL